MRNYQNIMLLRLWIDQLLCGERVDVVLKHTCHRVEIWPRISPLLQPYRVCNHTKVQEVVCRHGVLPGG